MHIHTLCGAGMLDGMPGSTTEAWCGDMATTEQAASLARQMLQWVPSQRFAWFHSPVQTVYSTHTHTLIDISYRYVHMDSVYTCILYIYIDVYLYI